MKPYIKQWDFKETEGADPSLVAYIPGSASGTAEIEKFLFGFEICFDHNNGALKAKTVDVDFHIVVSDSVGTNKGNITIAVGGYFIHASTSPKQTGVYYRDGSGVQSAGNPSAGATQSNHMAYWVVEVAKRAAVQPVAPVQKVAVAATGVRTPGGKLIPGAVKLPGMT